MEDYLSIGISIPSDNEGYMLLKCPHAEAGHDGVYRIILDKQKRRSLNIELFLGCMIDL